MEPEEGGGTRRALVRPRSECHAKYKRPLGCQGPICPGGTLRVNPWPRIPGSGAPLSHKPFPQGRREDCRACFPGRCHPPAVRAWALGRNAGAQGEGLRVWLSSCPEAPGSQGPAGHLSPHPLTHSLSLKGPIFPYMVRAVPRGGGWGQRSLSLRQPAPPQLPETSQVAAAFSSQVSNPAGTHGTIGGGREQGPSLLSVNVRPPEGEAGCPGVWEEL